MKQENLKTIQEAVERSGLNLVPDASSLYLHHILMLLEQKRVWVHERFKVSSKGYLERFELKDGELECTDQVIWSMPQPLSNQSEETLQFLADLLSNTK